MESFGLKVVRSVPSQRGFNQPCPLWKGQCTIYALPHYPRFCQTYKCKLLQKLLDETISLPHALTIVEDAKTIIQQVEEHLPESTNTNFRERLAEQIEGATHNQPEFQRKADRLLTIYEEAFGVTDVVDHSEEGQIQGRQRPSNNG